LQSIVDDNRTNNRITILCAFVDGTVKLNYWKKVQAKHLVEHKSKVSTMAVQFKTNPMLDHPGMVL
jgi:hypothetical protein